MRRSWITFWTLGLPLTTAVLGQTPADRVTSHPAGDSAGFRGIWYEDMNRESVPAPPCRGGLATFSPHHAPMAIHSEKAHKTFFVYGGSSPPSAKEVRLQISVAFYDHRTAQVSRPTVVVERRPPTAHANPSLSLDGQGYLYVFAPNVHADEAGELFKSRLPYEIGGFERVASLKMADPQVWYVEKKGFLLFCIQRHDEQQTLCYATSLDGVSWSNAKALAEIEEGADAVSWSERGKVGVAFAFHPRGGAAPTGLYYLETSDGGQSWTTAQHESVKPPLTQKKNAAQVFDYESTGQAVYLKDLNFDAMGNPSILYMVTPGGAAGQKGPYPWMTARWVARGWRISSHFQSDDVADSGSLYVEHRSEWRIVAPTAPGPEPGGPGGEVVMWMSDDFGRAWERTDFTRGSELNHNYVRRPVNAQPDFYAFWADGAIRRPSESRLYFATRDGKVYQLPEHMSDATAQPKLVWEPPARSKPEE